MEIVKRKKPPAAPGAFGLMVRMCVNERGCFFMAFMYNKNVIMIHQNYNKNVIIVR